MSAARPLVALAGEAAVPADAGAGADPEPARAVLLRSPAVGVLKDVPRPGQLLGPGRPFARLRVLDRTHALLAPEGLAGVVVDVKVDGAGADAVPVEFGQPILALAPLGAGAGSGAGAAAAAAPGPAAGGGVGAGGEILPRGAHAVLSPADGVFYRRPRPAEPPYVEVGSRVRAGQTLALIEAMKCFSAIAYGGPGLPEEAEVAEIRAADVSEVRHGQVLFVVR